VIAASASRSGTDLGYGTPGKVDLVVSGKLFTTGSTASGDTVYFRPETETSAATNWGGVLLDQSVYGGSVIEYADIGYAWNPLYVFFSDSLTTVRHSRIHHFAGIGVWVDGSLGQGGIVESNTIVQQGVTPFTAGGQGLLVDQAPAVKVLDNRIDITGVSGGSVITSAVRAYFGNAWCNTAPSDVDTLRIAGNLVVGPGAGTDGTYTGIRADWLCGTDDRKIEIVRNYIQDFDFAGLEFLQTEDVRADSNNVVNSYRGVEVSRDTTVVGPAVRFKANWLEVRDSQGEQLVRTDNKPKTLFGPASAGRGHNGLEVLEEDIDFMLSEDPASGTVNAKDCYWYLYNGTTGDAFLSSQEDIVDEIFTRLSLSSGHFVVSPIQTDDSSPTYYRLSGPPGVGRIVAGTGTPSAVAEAVDGRNGIPDLTSLSSFGNPTGGPADMVLAVDPSHEGWFRIEVFDVRGRRVVVLREQVFEPGHHSMRWTGETSSGDRAAAGTYFVRVEGPGFHTTRKLVLLK
jgi:hypothetical protein